MVDDEIDYTPYFKDILSTAENGKNIKMCLLKKTQSKKEEKKRVLLNVEVDKEVPTLLRNNITKIYNIIVDNNELKCADFFTGEKAEKTMFVINEDNMNDVGTLDPIISRIIKDDDSNATCVTEFDAKTIDNLQSHAIFLSFLRKEKGVNIKDSCIFFRKYNKGTKISKEQGILLALGAKKGKFTRVDGDVFKFDNLIDATYYERRYLNNSNSKDIKIMFVWNLENFEEIFSFDEFYKQQALEVYDKLNAYDNIEVEVDFYNNFISKKGNLRKMCTLNKKDVFSNIDMQTFSKIYKIALSKDCDFSLLVDGEIIRIENEKAFNEFIHLCQRQVVGDLIDEKIVYIGNVKRMPIKVKQESV